VVLNYRKKVEEMIPRKILKKIRQIEIRTNRIVPESAAALIHRRIPTGFWLKAQGCEARATLGQRSQNIYNRNAVAAIPVSSNARGICHNPVGVVHNLIPFTQGSSFVATLGWRTQSRWDWPNRVEAEIQTAFTAAAKSAIGNRQSKMFP
jgi:hypothetical protein